MLIVILVKDGDQAAKLSCIGLNLCVIFQNIKREMASETNFFCATYLKNKYSVVKTETNPV